MRKNSTMKNRTNKLVTRGRAAVVGGGMVAAIAMGSTAAFASASHENSLAGGSASHVTAAVHQQASGQKAAAAKAAEAKKKHAPAHHKARSAAWVTPTTGYVLGAGFAQAGPHWIHKHSGQDFVVKSGTTVRAAHAGTVVTAGWGGAYGNNIVIKHGPHLYTQYGHLSHIGVYVGQHVKVGQQIGKSGSTGNSTGPHLHFEVRKTAVYGSAIEPLHFLRAHGVHV